MEVKKLTAFILLTLVGLTFAAPTDSDHGSLLASQDSNHARSALDLTALEQNFTLSSRQTPPMFQQLCIPINTQPWDVANQLAILSGISYLRSVTVPCNTGPGPGNCVRVSCSYDAAIYLCNDNPDSSLWIDCNEVADYAQNIHDDCQSTYRCGRDTCYGCGGQQFSTDDWNVIVRWDSC